MAAPSKLQIIPDALTGNLWRIAEVGDVDQLEQALARGADVNACNTSGVTALMVAACHDRLEMVRALVEHGAELNAVDRNGLTAEMMADDAGHDEIVRTLVGLGVKRSRTPPVIKPSPVPSTQEKSFEAIRVSDVPPRGREPEEVMPRGTEPEVRTLKEPPDIWDLVHETRTEFKPGSAFVGRITALRPLMLAAIFLIIGGGAGVLLALRDWSGSHAAERSVQAESSNAKTVLSPQSTLSNKAESSSNQQSNVVPARTDAAVSTIDNSKTAVTAAAAGSTIDDLKNVVTAAAAGSTIDDSTTAVTDASALSASSVRGVARRRPKSMSSTTASRETVDGTDNKGELQASTARDPESDNDKGANLTAAKREPEKALSPQLIAPARPGSTPKGKVIPWP